MGECKHEWWESHHDGPYCDQCGKTREDLAGEENNDLHQQLAQARGMAKVWKRCAKGWRESQLWEVDQRAKAEAECERLQEKANDAWYGAIDEAAKLCAATRCREWTPGECAYQIQDRFGRKLPKAAQPKELAETKEG